jgi:hypothetical protein
MLVVITILTTLTLTTTIAAYAGDHALQPSKHFFKSNGNPSVDGLPLDDTTTAMQPIEENNADALQPSKHFFKSNGNPSVDGLPLDDTTTAMQPIEENNADALQPSKDNMETKMLMEKNIVH